MNAIGATGTPVKHLTREVKDLNLDLAEQNLLSLSYGRIIRKDIDSNEGLLPASFERYTIVRPGDVVLRLTDLQNDQRSLRTGLVREQGIITSAYLTLRPSADVDDRFLAYALHALDVSKVFYTLGGGLRQSMGMEEIGGLRLDLPRVEEQRRVADFLDDQVTRIDGVVAARQAQIETLQEATRSAISAELFGSAATAQQSSNARNWFPGLPQSWRVTRLGPLCSLIADGPHFSPAYEDDGFLFLSTRNVRMQGLDLSDVKYVSEPDFLEFCKRVVPRKGDVLYTKGGTTGIALAVDFDLAFQVWVHVAVLRPRPHLVDENYLAAALNSVPCYAQSQLFTRGATNNDLGLTRMVDIVLPLPPREEQAALAQRARAVVESVRSLELELQAAESLLQEYKRSLITAAVTGELDVTTARRGVTV